MSTIENLAVSLSHISSESFATIYSKIVALADEGLTLSETEQLLENYYNGNRLKENKEEKINEVTSSME